MELKRLLNGLKLPICLSDMHLKTVKEEIDENKGHYRLRYKYGLNSHMQQVTLAPYLHGGVIFPDF